MKTNPSISVIIPVYKVEKFLPRCLDSVLKQTFSDFEVICVNDGSPDNCKKILSDYARADKRIHVINKENTGVSDTRNVGMKHATGKYILFMDSDDCIHPQTLEITYVLAEKHNADLVNFRYINKEYKDIHKDINKKYNVNKIRVKITDDLLKFATERSHGGSKWKIRHGYICSHLFRHDFIKDFTFPTHIKIYEDFVWWSKVLRAKPHSVITRVPLYFYIPNVLSASGNLNPFVYILNISDALDVGINTFQDAEYKDKKIYANEFVFPFVISMVRNIKRLRDESEMQSAKQKIFDIYSLGVLNNPKTWNDIKYYFKIKKLLRK